MLRIGVRAHDFGKLPADVLAKRIADKGFCCTQLAVNKAIEGIDLQRGDMTPGLAWHIGQAFSRAGVQIAVLGCYINPIHPDVSTRRQLLGYFRDHLRCAKDFGCSIVGLETGTVNADYSPHPDTQSDRAFDHLLASIGELVAEAEKQGAIVCIEGVTCHTVSTPKRMRKVLDVINSCNLQVIFDPVNFLSIENYQRQDHVVEESIELFGDRIAIIHAKDFVVEGSKLKQVGVGEGQFNFTPLLKFVQQKKPGISILMEEATEAMAEQSLAFFHRAAETARA
jgi:sugar phosphate isomerase/epimerase